jgi:predicted dehydrogenase
LAPERRPGKRRSEKEQSQRIQGVEIMTEERVRVGLIGAGANTRSRHIPGLQQITGVEIVAVCNRRPASTAAVAREYNIPRIYQHWQELLGDQEVDAIVIGTWPYLHGPITLAALEAGKHVLTEARMSMNAAEAHQMLQAARQRPTLVTQVVPSPFGLKGNAHVKQLLQQGYVGELREVHVFSRSAALADPVAPLSWRQDAALSGYNMLTLGIVHETLMRWVPPLERVLAQVHAFVPARIDPESGVLRSVGTPDSVQVLGVLQNGARLSYHFSGATPFGQGMRIELYGTEGALHYDLARDRITGLSRAAAPRAGSQLEEMQELPIPEDLQQGWRVEQDFIDSIRHGKKVELTSFEAGVAYMEFTEAVARSAELGEPVELPLGEFSELGG